MMSVREMGRLEAVIGRLGAVIAFGIVLLGAHSAIAQWHSHDSRMYFDYGDPMMTSVIQSADGHAADVRLTTANSMFSFVRTANSAKGQYYAIRDVTIEVVEKGEAQPVITRNVVDTLYAKTFDESISKTSWHARNEHLALPMLDSNKSYSVRIEIRDDIDRMTLHAAPFELRPTTFANVNTRNGIAIGDIALADDMSNGVATTSGQGNSYMFSHDIEGSVSFKLAPVLHSDPMVDISVRQLTNLVNPSDTGERYRGALDASDLRPNAAYEYSSADSVLRYKLVPTNDSGVWTALFNVPGQTFEQGKYTITVRVRAGSVEQSQTNDVELVWQGMPLSLEDPTDAIEPLGVIAPPETVQAMSSGSKQDMTRKLYAYWKTLDPTPGTAYNERMATFYQRVDYADFNFANGRMLNGAMTDRGKVYLLYGPPTKVERSFLPGEAPTETWTYNNNVGRTFCFEARNSPGNYELTDIKELSVAEK